MNFALSDRIYRALKRVSRDRWISPDQVWEYGLKFALCKTNNMTDAMNAVRRSVQGNIETQDAARASGASRVNQFWPQSSPRLITAGEKSTPSRQAGAPYEGHLRECR